MKYSLGIGTDIESIERFENFNKIKKRNFLDNPTTKIKQSHLQLLFGFNIY